jgi:hypothetical protein
LQVWNPFSSRLKNSVSDQATTRTVNKYVSHTIMGSRLGKGKKKIVQRNHILDFRCQSRWAPQNIVGFLKNTFARILRFFLQYRKLALLLAVVVLITFIFSFLLLAWFGNNSVPGSNSNYSPDGNGGNVPNSEYDRNVSTSGTIKVEGLEIYGGDVTVESGKVYIDWGELTLGSSKKATFYVLSNSNVNVTLGLNVTNWTPAGIEDYITISWNYNGVVLSPEHEPLSVTVSLNVSSSREFIDFLVENNVTSFGFDIIVYASEV